MSEISDSVSEEERSLFRPFTRESLAAIEARIAEQESRHRELERKRAEGEVSTPPPYFTSLRVTPTLYFSLFVYLFVNIFSLPSALVEHDPQDLVSSG